MKRQRHKKKKRPPPEKTPGMIFVSQGACKREKSFRESRKGLANEKYPPGSLARGLQMRKILPGVSQGACKREKSFRWSRKGLAREKYPFGRLASGLQERTAQLSLYFNKFLNYWSFGCQRDWEKNHLAAHNYELWTMNYELSLVSCP